MTVILFTINSKFKIQNANVKNLHRDSQRDTEAHRVYISKSAPRNSLYTNKALFSPPFRKGGVARTGS
jgi:hypothetical protein